MIHILGRKNSANVQKALWALAECNRPCDVTEVGGAFGGLDTDDYGALNPNRRVPTYIDGDFVMWESNAMVRYIAAKYGAGDFYPQDFAARAHADMWMDWSTTTVFPALTPVFWGLVRTPEAERDLAKIAASAKQLGSVMQRLDGWLKDRAFVAGETFTMGDIPVGVLAWRYYSMPIDRPATPNLDAWHARLNERPAFNELIALPLT